MDSQVTDRDATNLKVHSDLASQSAVLNDLFNDPVFIGIHNALLLGWNIVELKSLIQVIACNVSLDSFTFDASSGSLIATVIDSPAAGRTSANSPTNVIDDLLKSVVLKDLAHFSSTAANIPPSKSLADALPSGSDNAAEFTRQLTTLFNRIVRLHTQRFPASDTINTTYDVPAPPSQSGQPYLYLYPPVLQSQEPDYATIGISNNKVSRDFIEKFKLYDLTRRALNCLILLFTDPEESLSPETAKNHIWRLVQNMLQSDHPPDCREDGMEIPQTKDLKFAVKILTALIIRLLDRWDSFLHMEFYSETSSSSSEAEQKAYEVGRSLASLFWSISLVMLSLENALTEEQLMAINDKLMEKVRMNWLEAFQEKKIVLLQNQVSALSTALDGAYYRHAQTVGIGSSNPRSYTDLPSQTIRVVKESLSYWQRALELLYASNSEKIFLPLFRWDLCKSLRLALDQQMEIWRSLLLHQQSLLSFTNEVVTKRILSDFQRDLEQDLERTVAQSLLKTVDEIAKEKTKRLRRNIIIAIAMSIVLVVFVIALLVPLPPWTKTLFTLFAPAATVALGLFDKLADLLKKFGVSSSENSKQDEKEEADQLFASAFRLDKVDLPSLLNSGRESLQVNFSYLDSALSVSQPLVDFFVEHDFLLLTEQYTVSIVERLNNEGSNAAGSEAQQQESSFSQRTITDAYDCLTKIFWTAEEREEEMQAIIRNAFGPLGTLMRVRQELSKPLSSSKLKNF